MKMGEKENFLRMTISDPELVQKICEGGMESLSPDDINSLGIEVKAGQMFMGMQVRRIWRKAINLDLNRLQLRIQHLCRSKGDL